MISFVRFDKSTNSLIHVLIRITGLLVIFGIALAIRLYPILSTPETSRAGFGPFGDSYLYHKIAYNIYKGNGYSGIDDGRAFGLPQKEQNMIYEPAITRGPVYPFFLASVYYLWGDETAMESLNRWHVNWDLVRIVQSLLDAMICLLIFGVARYLYSDTYLPAFVAAALYSICFYNIYYTRMLLSETVTTFLVTVAVIAGVMALKSQRLIYWLGLGAGFGLASLSRPEYILYPFFLTGFIFLYRPHNIRYMTKSFIFMICGLGLVMTPWISRNYNVYHQFIPTSVGAIGYNLFSGTYENGDWAGWGKYPDRIFKNKELKQEVYSWQGKLGYHLKRGTIGLKEYDVKFRSLALNTIKENPFACFMTWIKRLPRLWYQNYIKMYLHHEPPGIWFILYFIFSTVAVILMKPAQRFACTPIILLFFYMNLIYLPLHIEPRYGVPIYPGMCLLTAIGFWQLGVKIYGKIFSHNIKIIIC